jgi:hypothetical protein
MPRVIKLDHSVDQSGSHMLLQGRPWCICEHQGYKQQ